MARIKLDSCQSSLTEEDLFEGQQSIQECLIEMFLFLLQTERSGGGKLSPLIEKQENKKELVGSLMLENVSGIIFVGMLKKGVEL